MKIVKKIISGVVTAVVLVVVGYYIFEFVRFSRGDEPYHCKEVNTYKYTDGTAEECVGFVFKRIIYTRTNKTEKVFVPLWKSVDEGYTEKNKK